MKSEPINCFVWLLVPIKYPYCSTWSQLIFKNLLTHYGCTTICSPIGGHLGGFQFGAITDIIAVSIVFKTLHGHVLSFPLSTSLDWNAWSVCERTFELCCWVAPLSLTLCSPWTAAHQAFLSFTNYWSQFCFLFFFKETAKYFPRIYAILHPHQ